MHGILVITCMKEQILPNFIPIRYQGFYEEHCPNKNNKKKKKKKMMMMMMMMMSSGMRSFPNPKICTKLRKKSCKFKHHKKAKLSQR